MHQRVYIACCAFICQVVQFYIILLYQNAASDRLTTRAAVCHSNYIYTPSRREEQKGSLVDIILSKSRLNYIIFISKGHCTESELYISGGFVSPPPPHGEY